jgi:hypothetical protein
MAQVGEHKALSSNPNITKRNQLKSWLLDPYAMSLEVSLLPNLNTFYLDHYYSTPEVHLSTKKKKNYLGTSDSCP